MSKTIFNIALAGTILTGAFALGTSAVRAEEAAAETKKTSPLDFTVESLDGKQIDLSQYKGKVVMIVNTASKCGLTPQYAPLESLYEKYNSDGLVILGFPCNQFHQQEPGSADDIKTFCTTKYGVKFPVMAKVEVNGEGACPLYKYLKGLNTKPKGPGEVTWNFEKFIIGRNGEVVARIDPKTRPESDTVTGILKAELAKK